MPRQHKPARHQHKPARQKRALHNTTLLSPEKKIKKVTWQYTTSVQPNTGWYILQGEIRGYTAYTLAYNPAVEEEEKTPKMYNMPKMYSCPTWPNTPAWIVDTSSAHHRCRSSRAANEAWKKISSMGYMLPAVLGHCWGGILGRNPQRVLHGKCWIRLHL